jgi:hypothetical protein
MVDTIEQLNEKFYEKLVNFINDNLRQEYDSLCEITPLNIITCQIERRQWIIDTIEQIVFREFIVSDNHFVNSVYTGLVPDMIEVMREERKILWKEYQDERDEYENFWGEKINYPNRYEEDISLFLKNLDLNSISDFRKILEQYMIHRFDMLFLECKTYIVDGIIARLDNDEYNIEPSLCLK